MAIQKGPSGALGTSIETGELANGSVTPAKLSTGGPTWDSSNRLGVGLTPANNNNPLQISYGAVGNPSYISINNSDASSDYSHAGLYMSAKNGAVYGAIFTDKANGMLRLGYNTTGSTFGINDSGNISSFGGNITFPASQNASANANTLDDYEEGTWSPAFTASGTSWTYSVAYGTYVKVGQMVMVQFYIKGAYSGTNQNMAITGLPFASYNGGSYSQWGGGCWSTTATAMAPLVDTNSTQMSLWKQGTSTTIFVASEISNAYIVGSIVYRSAS